MVRKSEGTRSTDSPALKEKALKYAEELGIDDFKASNGWFDRWKSRHEISFKTISGEALLTFILARWPVQFPVFQKAVDLFTIYQWFPTWGLRTPCGSANKFWWSAETKACAGGLRKRDRVYKTIFFGK